MKPILLQIGDVTVPSYLVLLVAGACLFVWVSLALAEREGLPRTQVAVVLGAVYVAALLGSRLLFVLEHPRLAADLLNPLPGGYASQGGLVLALAVGTLLIRGFRLPWGAVADSIVPGLAILGFLGRLGCFLGGCCYGRPTTLPWGVVFPAGSEATARWGSGVPLHPVQLYEAAAFVGLAGLYAWIRKRRAFAGQAFLWALLAYSATRFTNELFRGDPRDRLAGLTAPQWLGLLLILLSFYILRRMKGREGSASGPFQPERKRPCESPGV